MADPKEPPKARQMTVFQDEIYYPSTQASYEKEPIIDTGMQETIGVQLKAVYEEIVEEPVPDRFLKLLAELKSKQERTS